MSLSPVHDPERVLQHDARTRIARILAESPGCHLRGLQRRTDMGLGQLRHHLKTLEAAGLVVRQRDGRKLRYYPSDRVPVQDRELVAAIYQEVPRRILALLVARPGARHSDLARALKRPAATVSYHLDRLQSAGLIHPVPRGHSFHYVISDPSRIRSALESHPETRRDETARRFMDTFGPMM